jgi:hypothetical protein
MSVNSCTDCTATREPAQPSLSVRRILGTFSELAAPAHPKRGTLGGKPMETSPAKKASIITMADYLRGRVDQENKLSTFFLADPEHR